MIEVSLRLADGLVIQIGTSLGARVGCRIITPTASQLDALADAFRQPHGNVYLLDSGEVTFDAPPTPELPNPQIAADRQLVRTFYEVPSGTDTAAQRDEVTKAILRYLRRMGQDA